MSKETELFKPRICEAIKQVSLGHPLKDFLDDEDVIKALQMLVGYIHFESIEDNLRTAIDNLKLQEFYTKPDMTKGLQEVEDDKPD
jgi:hypothetical protein